MVSTVPALVLCGKRVSRGKRTSICSPVLIHEPVQAGPPLVTGRAQAHKQWEIRLSNQNEELTSSPGRGYAQGPLSSGAGPERKAIICYDSRNRLIPRTAPGLDHRQQVQIWRCPGRRRLPGLIADAVVDQQAGRMREDAYTVPAP